MRVVGLAAFASFLLAGAAPAPSPAPASSPAPAASPTKESVAAPVTATSGGATASTEKPDGLVSANEALGKDVLDEALSWNGTKYAHPSSTFRAGGVTKRKVDAS